MKKQDKKLFFNKVIKSAVKEHFEGFEKGCSVEMKSISHLTIPEIKRVFRREVLNVKMQQLQRV